MTSLIFFFFLGGGVEEIKKKNVLRVFIIETNDARASRVFLFLPDNFEKFQTFANISRTVKPRFMKFQQQLEINKEFV